MKACFYSSEGLESILRQQYSLQDIWILKELGFDVVIASRLRDIPLDCDLYFGWWASGSILPLIISLIVRKPIIVVAGGNEAVLYRDSLTGVPGGYLGSSWIKRLATRITLKLATEVLVVSKFMVKDVERFRGLRPCVVYNTVDTSFFLPAKVADRPKWITMVANLESPAYEVKRCEVFVKAIEFVRLRHPDVRFRIVGRKGAKSHALRQLSNELGVESFLDFVGPVTNVEMPGLLCSSAAYVQISDTETFGLTVAEAMSCEVPVIVSRRGALPEVVGDCGFYVDHNDPLSVARAINSLLEMGDAERLALLRRGRRRVIRNYHRNDRKRAIAAIIQRIL